MFIIRIFIFVNALKHSVHLLLQEQFQFLDHKLIDGTSLDKIGNQAFNGVSFVDNNPLEAEVRDIDVDEKFWFCLSSGLSSWRFLFFRRCHRLTLTVALVDRFNLRVVIEFVYDFIVGILNLLEESCLGCDGGLLCAGCVRGNFVHLHFFSLINAGVFASS